MKIDREDAQRLRDTVNADVKDDGARILLHRAINALPVELQVVSAPRPDVDNRASWRALIASSLTEGQQADFEAHEFVPCYTCSIQPGSPTLCRGCLANRQTIAELREARTAGLEKLMVVQRGLAAASHDAATMESRLNGMIAVVEQEI